MKDKFYKLKQEYMDYIILFKYGSFYICFNSDAMILNEIFNYKILEIGNFIKCGFPLNSLNKIINELENKEINYLVFNDDISDRKKFKENNYKNYGKNKNIRSVMKRINEINTILKDNINNPNIINIVEEIEEVLCKINY